MNSIGDRIKKIRQEKNLSLKDLEAISLISASTLQRYETGISKIPIDRLERISKALEVTPSYLMGWESKEIPSDEYGLIELIEPLLEYIGWETTYNCENKQFILYNIDNKGIHFINYKQLKKLMDKTLSYFEFELQNIMKANTK